MSKNDGCIIGRFTIPASQKATILEEMKILGIDRGMLFADSVDISCEEIKKEFFYRKRNYLVMSQLSNTFVYLFTNFSSYSFGSFFGPSQPVIAQRVIQESKSLLENPHLALKMATSNSSVCIAFLVLVLNVSHLPGLNFLWTLYYVCSNVNDILI